jgi:hypothetical protein
MEYSAPNYEQRSGTMDPMTSHFDDVLARRAAGAMEAIDAARLAIRKCRQQRIEAYLVRKEVHSSICRLRDQVARARLLALVPAHEFPQDC